MDLIYEAYFRTVKNSLPWKIKTIKRGDNIFHLATRGNKILTLVDTGNLYELFIDGKFNSLFKYTDKKNLNNKLMKYNITFDQITNLK